MEEPSHCVEVESRRPRVLDRALGFLARVLCAGQLLAAPALGQASEAPPLIDLLARAARESESAEYKSRRLAVERSALESRSFAAPSLLQLQSEGFGDSFQREQNSIDYVRWVRPFVSPLALSARRDLRDASSRWSSGEERALTLEVGAEVAALWIAWSAEVSAERVRFDRLQRIDRALEILRLRFEVGEVAGSEVRQLEAQRADDASALAEHGLRSAELRYELEALLGFGAPAPDQLSLSQLRAWLDAVAPGPPPAANDAPKSLELDRLEARSEIDVASARLAAARAAGDPGVAVEYEHVPSISGSETIDALGFQVELPLPFGRSVRARRALARERVALAEEELRRGRLRVARDSRLLETRERSSRDALAQLTEVLEALDTTTSSLAEQFRLGSISYLRFLDGLGRLDEVKLRQVRLVERLLRTRVDLARLTGDGSWFPLPSLTPAVSGVTP